MTSSAASEPVVRSPRGRAASLAWVAAAVCAVGGGALFQFFGNANHGYINTDSLFWWWGYQWCNAASETQHGWGILAAAIGLGWWNLRASGRAPSAGSSRFTIHGSSLVAPLVAMLGGLGLHAVGFVGQQARVSILGLLLFIWGVLRLGGGRRWGEATAFPVTFLVFAIPVNVLDSVGFWLRLWVIDAGVAIAHLAGIAVVQNGTLMQAPDGRYGYDMAAACSGVRSLAALAALSLVFGYLSFRTWRRRLAILLLGVPLVYVGNVARIVAIVFAAQLGGARWGEIVHTIMGYALFAIVAGGLIVGAIAIRRWAPEATAGGDRPEPKATSPLEGVADESAPTGSVVAVVTTMVVVAVGVTAGFLQRVSRLPSRGGVGVVLAADGENPVELPAFLGREWVGWPAPITGPEREILPPDTGYSRINYVAMNPPRSVFASIVLSGRDRSSIHRPELCLVGQGWTIRRYGTHWFAYPGAQRAGFAATVLSVDRRLVQSGITKDVPQLVAYWFVSADQVVATHWARLRWDAWNRVVHGRADRWAYVLVQTDATDGETAALARLQSVLSATLPAFQKVHAQVPEP